MQQNVEVPAASEPQVGPFERGLRLFGTFLQYVLMAVALMMSVLISYQVIARYVFNTPSSITESVLRYSLIWMGLLGAAYCFIDNLHLNLPLLAESLSRRGARRLSVINAVLTIGLGSVLIWGGAVAVASNSATNIPLLNLPVGWMQTVLVVSGVLIVLSQLVQLGLRLREDGKNSFFDVLLGVVIVAVIATLWMVFRTTGLYETLTFDYVEIFSALLLFGSFFIMLALGTPIAVALGISGILTLSLQLDTDMLVSTAGEQMFSSLDSFGFLALPFFILAGNIMNQGGIARRLIDLAMVLGRRVPGSLWQANVLANMLFGCLSGSAIAAATAIGSMISPIAKEKNYDMPVTTAVNAASAPSGMLIPPSGPFIIYSLITGGSASIIALFLAGYLPGIIMGVAVMIGAVYYAKKHKYPVDKTPTVWSDVAQVFLRALPSLSLIVVVIGGIVGGVFTAVEGSGVAVVYSFLLAVFYRSLNWKSLMRATADTVITSGIILFLISCSSLMSWSMTFASIPDTVGTMLTTISDNKYVILLLINIVLLIVGVFMDMTPALLIFTPILFPVVTEMGVDPVHFGVIMIYNLSMGVVTPPVGTVLFVSCSITGENITRIIKPLLPILLLQIIGLLFVTYLPSISLILPRLFGIQ